MIENKISLIVRNKVQIVFVIEIARIVFINFIVINDSRIDLELQITIKTHKVAPGKIYKV